MLRQRIITAAILLGLLLPTLAVAPVWPFALLALAAFAVATWEWGRLNGAHANAFPLAIAFAVACGAALWAGWPQHPPRGVWWTATLVWVLGGAWALHGGPAAWPKLPAALRSAIGFLMLCTAWLALANAKAVGLNFILSLLALVWAADISAYFGGRAFGKRKLAPSISPGKSWAGVWSGMAGALVVAALWLLLDKSFRLDSASFYSQLAARFGPGAMAVVVVILVAMSVVGDLFESLVKRSAGAKDSSALLPGHGGVLDRIDALLPVFPIALALLSLPA